MKKKTMELSVYFIQWEDSTASSGWRYPESLNPEDIIVIKSVGILVHQTKRTVTITTSIGVNDSVMDPLSIPRSCIRKMKKI